MGTDRITDRSDLATALEEIYTRAAITQRKLAAPPPCGECLNCGEPLAEGHRWCDADCRADWEKREGRA